MGTRLLILACIAFRCMHAQETCPWLNAATASGALGAPVKEQFARPAPGRDLTVCTFRSSSPESEVRLEVKLLPGSGKDFPAFSSDCRAHGQAVRAIGNEAFACSLANETFEVAGRVRDQGFRLYLRLAAPPPDPAPAVEKARLLAEIVAGNLF